MQGVSQVATRSVKLPPYRDPCPSCDPHFCTPNRFVIENPIAYISSKKKSSSNIRRSVLLVSRNRLLASSAVLKLNAGKLDTQLRFRLETTRVIILGRSQCSMYQGRYSYEMQPLILCFCRICELLVSNRFGIRGAHVSNRHSDCTRRNSCVHSTWSRT